jgi:hypothetical protein
MWAEVSFQFGKDQCPPTATVLVRPLPSGGTCCIPRFSFKDPCEKSMATGRALGGTVGRSATSSTPYEARDNATPTSTCAELQLITANPEWLNPPNLLPAPLASSKFLVVRRSSQKNDWRGSVSLTARHNALPE